MSGLGNTAFGSTPYGLGDPGTSTGTAGPLFPDATGTTQGSRFIDPVSRQYAYNANGRSLGMPSTEQLVMMALLTVSGSSAQTNLGLAMPSGVIGPNFVQDRTKAYSDALSALVKAKRIEVVRIAINASVRPIQSTVVWRDLTTSIEQETTV